MGGLTIRLLEATDVDLISSAFTAIGWQKPVSQYEHYLEEQRDGTRVVLLAFQNDAFAGYLTIVWRSSYTPFRDAGIPEIVDFNILPRLRRQGIGSQLMDEAEHRIAER